MEGVMMKNLDRYAVAVRKPDHEIEVMTDEYKSLGSRYAVLGLPIIRGVVNFGESLYIGLYEAITQEVAQLDTER